MSAPPGRPGENSLPPGGKASRAAGASLQPAAAAPPFGRIDLETLRESPADLDLISHRTRGRLIADSGEVLGVSFFTTHRRQPERAFLSAAEILEQLDAISQEDRALAEALIAWRPGVLESTLNTSCLLVSERIEVFAPAQGSGAWKTLYFTTLGEAVAGSPQRPDTFFFKVFPLDYAGRLTEHNRDRFDAAVRRLKLFYAAHVNARALAPPGRGDCYMRAPVPRAEGGAGRAEQAGP